MPDEALMRELEHERGKGRDDYPVRAVWNSLLAGIVFQHPTIESLRRELLRNRQLRQVCGFRPGTVPPPSVCTRFLQHLIDHESLPDQMFDDLVEALRIALPPIRRTSCGVQSDRPITLVLDNARYQRNAYVMGEAVRLGITLLWLPTYSPNLNLIERLWKFVKADGLHGRYFATFAPFKEAILDCLDNAPTRHKAQLDSLLTLNFQPFKSAS